ncbi:efflux RND transporter permease subunit [Legionella lytica]|uniref:Efflux RND transporter permease subunit n=1 Tax=Legionella lytica TaxID=96232 RepID=A0ABW8D4H1_9GAMM
MNVTTYFLKHPVIAIILNLLIALVGVLCYHSLAIREYPAISFPVITVNTSYANASPQLVESAVTNPLEEQLAGVEGVELMNSYSNTGFSHIKLVFRPGTVMDRALNSTQEAVELARVFLPENVRAPKIERQNQSDGLPFIGISIESRSLSFGELTHYAQLNLKNAFRSVNGVASVAVWGRPYTYEINLDPKKLYAFGINADEVASAIAANRLSLPAGKYQNKIPTTLEFDLKTAKDYENLLIKKVNNNPVFLKSLAQVRLKTDDSQFQIKVNGQSGVVLSIERANDANPLEVSQAIRKELKALKKTLPDDMKIRVIIDQSEFIRASLKNIKSSIFESILLVLVIVFLFLRNIRSILIPLVTIPISLLGSLLFLKLCGFSINQMTLLAMVLAVGLVVDDAIIILENIWRYIEEGLSPMEAALKGAKQISFAIVSMTFTLASVYAPLAFIDGMIGQLFIEFAVALAGSVFISGVIALTLSPLMCSSLLTKNTNQFWPKIDVMLDKLSTSYINVLSSTLSKTKLTLFVALMTVGISLFFYQLLPRETAPKEDRGLIGVYTPRSIGENVDDMDAKGKQVEQVIGTLPETKNQLAFSGDWGSNIILPLKPHAKRQRSATEIVASLRPQMATLRSTDASVWSWDDGLPGTDTEMNGNELELVLSTTENYEQLYNKAEQLKALLARHKAFESVRHNLRLDSMGYVIEVDKSKLAKLGLTPAQVARTTEVFFSGDKSINFQKDNVVYNLTLQGKSKPWDIDELYLTTPLGHRVSLGTVASMKNHAQPASLEHVNQMRSTSLHVQLAPKQSFKQGMDSLWSIAKANLPSQYKLSWAGTAKTYNESSRTLLLFLLSILFIYSILCIQFENFVYPLIILVTIPLACSGALVFAYLFGQSLNIFTEVGLITLIGLITKHGILIVEFANQLQKEGVLLLEAIKKSCALRLRPILMTTGAMIFGVIPLVLSHDAGAEARRAIGMILLGGLSLGTLFTLFVLPTIYYMVSRVLNKHQ